jgi:hypothetical protein
LSIVEHDLVYGKMHNKTKYAKTHDPLCDV